jgi:cathepsin A (carboxypeptidase C)
MRSWMGNEAWTDALEWPGGNKFRTALSKDFKVESNGQVAGRYKSAMGFTFMRVIPFLYLY